MWIPDLRTSVVTAKPWNVRSIFALNNKRLNIYTLTHTRAHVRTYKRILWFQQRARLVARGSRTVNDVDGKRFAFSSLPLCFIPFPRFCSFFRPRTACLYSRLMYSSCQRICTSKWNRWSSPSSTFAVRAFSFFFFLFFRFSVLFSTLCWNTHSVPTFSEKRRVLFWFKFDTN